MPDRTQIIGQWADGKMIRADYSFQVDEEGNPVELDEENQEKIDDK
jgi:hypothetical protein